MKSKDKIIVFGFVFSLHFRGLNVTLYSIMELYNRLPKKRQK